MALLDVASPAQRARRRAGRGGEGPLAQVAATRAGHAADRFTVTVIFFRSDDVAAMLSALALLRKVIPHQSPRRVRNLRVLRVLREPPLLDPNTKFGPVAPRNGDADQPYLVFTDNNLGSRPAYLRELCRNLYCPPAYGEGDDIKLLARVPTIASAIKKAF